MSGLSMAVSIDCLYRSMMKKVTGGSSVYEHLRNSRCRWANCGRWLAAGRWPGGHISHRVQMIPASSVVGIHAEKEARRSGPPHKSAAQQCASGGGLFATGRTRLTGRTVAAVNDGGPTNCGPADVVNATTSAMWATDRRAPLPLSPASCKVNLATGALSH